MLVLWTTLLLILVGCSNFTAGCTAGLGLEQITQDRLVGQSNNVSRDDPVVNGLANAVNFAASADPAPQNVNVTQLACNDFSNSCPWRTSDLSLLPWYQSNYKFDSNVLRFATGTDIQPTDSYAITVSQSGNATDFSILESPAFCQAGSGVLMLRAWTSNGVQLQACTKTDIAPSFSYCSLLMTSDNQPGPFYVTIPQPTPQASIKLYLVATSFNYTSDRYKGGFAAIDEVAYRAQDCAGGLTTVSPVSSSSPPTGSPTSGLPPTLPPTLLPISINSTAVSVLSTLPTGGTPSSTSTPTSLTPTISSTSTTTTGSPQRLVTGGLLSTTNMLAHQPPSAPRDVPINSSIQDENSQTTVEEDATDETTTSSRVDAEQEILTTTEAGKKKASDQNAPKTSSTTARAIRLALAKNYMIAGSSEEESSEDGTTEDSDIVSFAVFSLPSDVTAATSVPNPVLNSNQSAADLTSAPASANQTRSSPQPTAQRYVQPNRLIARLPEKTTQPPPAENGSPSITTESFIYPTFWSR